MKCMSELVAHRELCLFGPFRCSCPEPDCVWEGCGDAIEEHLAMDRHTKVSKRIVSGTLDYPVKQAFYFPRNSPADLVVKVDDKVILRGITVEKERYVFEISVLCYLTEEAATRELKYELRFGITEEALTFKGKVPAKGMGKHYVYVHFDQIKHMVRPESDVLAQSQKKNTSPQEDRHMTPMSPGRSPKAERLLEFSHKFQLCPQ